MLIKQTARCRIVVTGAYHAAVFALAQGIPVVCLSNSPYYLAKFQGLEDLFGLGCATVRLSEPDLPARLAAAIERTWNSAEACDCPCSNLPSVRSKGVGAYQRVKDLLEFTSQARSSLDYADQQGSSAACASKEH